MCSPQWGWWWWGRGDVPPDRWWWWWWRPWWGELAPNIVGDLPPINGIWARTWSTWSGVNKVGTLNSAFSPIYKLLLTIILPMQIQFVISVGIQNPGNMNKTLPGDMWNLNFLLSDFWWINFNFHCWWVNKHCCITLVLANPNACRYFAQQVLIIFPGKLHFCTLFITFCTLN